MKEGSTKSNEVPVSKIIDVVSPVELAEGDPGDASKKKKMALCLSGGGYRAMLFHAGALWRLNEFGYLPKLDRVSSVSGGSITAAVLGLSWEQLDFDCHGIGRQFIPLVVEPIRNFARKTVDLPSILGGTLTFSRAGNKLAAAYRKFLFSDKTLQDLPDEPRFVINATNVQSGSLWRFSKPYMRDYRVGEVKNPTIKLAVAVAASSAFPPVLSPVRIILKNSDFTPSTGKDLQREPFTTRVVLTDGGVYDNLGLETAWKTHGAILISDAGGNLAPQGRPKGDWIRHLIRDLLIIDNQVRNLRKRQILEAFELGAKKGTYWGIRTDMADYNLTDALDCPFEKTIQLANIATRLKALSPVVQEQLINWGYAVCDAAVRKYIESSLPKPSGFPYLSSGVG